MQYNAFITAGGRLHGDLAEIAGTDIKAMIRINGQSLLQRAIYALRESGSVGKIALVAPEEIREIPDARGADFFIPCDKSGVLNIKKGLEYFQEDRHVILCTSDLPFITAHSVMDFLARCPDDAAVCYPIFEKNEINPDMRPGVPSFIKLKDGNFTGGSIFRLHTETCLARMKEVGQSFLARKSTFGMAKLLGFTFILKFMLGLCTSEDLINRAGEIMKGKCAGIRGCDAGITVDIDDERSYNFSIEYANREIITEN